MILLAGLTPAWQQTIVLDRFEYGEVNRAREVHWCASGKVLNAAVAAHLLQTSSLVLVPVGGPAAERFEQEFDTLGLRYRWVRTAVPTRVCTTILDRGTNSMTELVEDARPLTGEVLKAFEQAFAEEAARADVVVLLGSLPLQAPSCYYRQLLEHASCPMVLDFRGDGLLSVLDLKPFLVKPIRQELAQTLGVELRTEDELLDAMAELNARGAQWVVITEGSGPVRVRSQSEALRVYPPSLVEVVNPLGSGDVMAATIAWATSKDHTPIDAIRLGVAAASRSVRQLLPGRFDSDRLEEEARRLRVETL